MKIRLGFLILFLFLLPGIITAQEKRRLSQEDYPGWKTLAGIDISPDGNWVIYQVNPQEYGDGNLIIRHIPSGREHIIPRGYRSAISPGGEFAVFHIKPEFAVERQAKLDGKRRNELPTDSIGFFVFDTARIEKLPGVVSYQLPDEPSAWVTYLIDNARIRQPKKEKEEEAEGENDESPADEEEEKEEPLKNKQLFIYNPGSGQRHVVDEVEQYVFAGNGSLVGALVETSENDTLDIGQVVAFDINTLEPVLIDSGEGDFRQINAHRDGDYLAWLHSADTIDEKVYELYLWERRRGRLNKAVDHEVAGMPAGYSPSENQRPYFSADGRRLFFGTAPKPEPEPEDTLLSEEKYSLDVWHWLDPQLQSQQKVQVARERRRTYQAVYHIRQEKMVQLADEQIQSVSLGPDNNLLVGMGTDDGPYMIERQWTGGGTRDIYLVDLNDGSRRMILERAESSVSLSLAGNYVIYYDQDADDWFAYSVSRGTTVNMTAGIAVPLYNEDNDVPREARPHGIAGWTPDDESVLIYDRYDVWKLDPRGRRAAENITASYGRDNTIRLRLQNLDRDEPFTDLSEAQFFMAFHEFSKQSGFYKFEGGSLDRLVMEDALYSGLQKASDAGRFLWRRSTFTEYSDLYTSALDFSGTARLSEANPQQSEFYWGSVKLVEWNSFNHNEPLQGLLYLPEDFDENKKYPMLVYFYERQSHTKHQHYIPSPSRSTINRSYCVSNGYVVFVPDITYREGFPGESAYDAIVSGTMAMVERYPFIDRDNLGLQGQSWGGYQIAFLITRTNLYKAAMAGAPVSNMISAYGGIRWQTGLNRQFQYEQTQSRIGGSLWERPLRYIENSPIFFADKVETPLLMMHNDDDGAVPWEQGIEYFVALRRLSKPVWMLVYNDEAHNLTRWPNRVDLDIRMYQFFDYYLKGKPAPVWMEEGIPAIDKGRVHGYELVE